MAIVHLRIQTTARGIAQPASAESITIYTRMNKILSQTLITILLSLGCIIHNVARADTTIVAHRYLADPAVFVHDGEVYFYCSNDNENALDGGYRMKSLVCVSSRDMKNWTDHGVVFDVTTDAPWANNSWAPSVIERDGKVFLYFGNGGGGIGVASSDSPTGPFKEPLGHELIRWSTPGAGGPNMWLFDPAAFIDDDGQAYLYFGGNGDNNVRVIKLNRDMISVSGEAQAMTAPAFFEASWMHKYKGTYYFSYSTNPHNGMRIDYMTSDNPTKDFRYGGVVASQPPNNNNNNHAGIFEFKGNWYLVFHDREVATKLGIPTTFKRNLGVEQVFYNDDNSIKEVTFTHDGLVQLENLNPLVRVEAETMAEQSGIKTEKCSEGGMNVTEISNGDWIRVRGVDFGAGVTSFAASVASTTDGSIQLRLDSPAGKLIGTCKVSSTGGLQDWSTANAKVDGKIACGIHDLYFVFADASEENFLSMDWWQFQ